MGTSDRDNMVCDIYTPQAGVHVQQKEEFTVTNRKVSDKVLAGKDLLYGRFIKVGIEVNL